MASNVVLSTKEFKVVGKRPIRHDGYDKVTGKARYGADIHIPGLLHGKILRSPHAHARIISIDTSRAEAHPDVRAVVTAKDLPEPADGQGRRARNILATGKVLYKGHAIAAVASTNPHVAEEVLSLIDVRYEVLPSVTNVEDAMKPGAPRLHDEYEGNVASHNQVELGDVDAGFERADVVVEKEFRTRTVHQGYIEPQNATASWGADDKITVWCSSQGHFEMGEETAGLVGVPVSRVKVVPMEIGGGFGGKTGVYLEPVAALLSRKSGYPVKLTMTRAEVLEATGPTSGTYQKVKIGVTKDGKLTAARAELMYEAGAFPGSPVGAAAQCMFAPYDVEDLLIDAYDVVVNKPATGAYRAPGSPTASYAAESLVDEICEKLSMDPLEFRILNGAKEGTRRANGVTNPRIGCIETAEAAKAHEHYSTPLEGPNRGRGVASGFWMNGAGPACATASVNPDGTVNLVIGTMDIGGSRATAAQQFAEELGIPAEDVNPQVGDTESIGFSSMAGGSSVTFKTGWACYEAAWDVKRQMLARAARIWEVSEDDVELVDAVFMHKTDPELQMPFDELASMLRPTGGAGCGPGQSEPCGRGQRLRDQHCRRRGGPRDGQGNGPAQYDRSGRGQGDSSELR